VLARTLIHTGPGGAGTTTAAAATAAHLAAGGTRTLLLAAGPGADLDDVLDVEVPSGGAPVAVAPDLDALRPGGQATLDRAWPELARALAARGARVSAAEPAPAPGLDAVAAALALQHALAARHHAAVVVDAGPLPAALALIAAPDAVRWWLARAVPQTSRLSAAAPPLPGRGLGALRRALREALTLADVLRDPDRVSVRLVAGPGALGARRTRRAVRTLALHAVACDAVFVRPAAVPVDLGPLAHLRVPAHVGEPVGPAALAELGAGIFARAEPLAVLTEPAPERLTITPEQATLRLPLPFARREDVHVRQVGAELVISLDGARRVLTLPPALAGYGPAGASYADDALVVTFTRTDTSPA
jgi:arsenite-transporting ATPase